MLATYPRHGPVFENVSPSPSQGMVGGQADGETFPGKLGPCIGFAGTWAVIAATGQHFHHMLLVKWRNVSPSGLWAGRGNIFRASQRRGNIFRGVHRMKHHRTNGETFPCTRSDGETFFCFFWRWSRQEEEEEGDSPASGPRMVSATGKHFGGF